MAESAESSSSGAGKASTYLEKFLGRYISKMVM
jgi:hypothetical protein